jgi:hypothetical protein
MKTLISKPLFLGLSLFLFAAVPARALQPEAAGHFQKLKGAASITRGSDVLPAVVGTPLYGGDTIRTAKASSASIVMADDSVLSLGPTSEMVLKNYIFNPKGGKFSFVTRMVKGTFGYLSGIISKLSPGSIQIETPDASISVRGTKLLVDVE